MDRLSEEEAGAAGLCVVHADAQLLVVDKPSGLLSVPGRGPENADCVAARAVRAFPDALIVHRLDMPTSGLLLLGRGPDAHRRLSADFEFRRVDKRYVAVVAGDLRPHATEDDGWATIDLPLAADWLNRPKQVVDAEAGRPSVTRWRVLAHHGDRTRVELAPLTGRSHQLRVHLQALGHPILGDALYASPAIEAMAPRLLLHATFLAVPHPSTGERIAFHSAPPF